MKHRSPPDEFDAERTFADGELRLRKSGDTVWIEVATYPIVTIEFSRLVELFEQPELAAGGTDSVIASPPTAYLLFGRGELGLDEVTTGDYRLTWIDLAEGRTADGGLVELEGGEETFNAPIDGDVALALRRHGR